LPIALVYPHTYYVGMSNLGFQAVYRLFNEEPDVVCERVFWEPEEEEPLSLESQRPLADFAVLAFSLSFELDYLRLAMMLRGAGIPVLAQERDEAHPLLIAGGAAVSANPEPLAPILDAFVIGEGEEAIPRLTEALREGLGEGKEAVLEALAHIEGFYIPSRHRGPVRRQWVRDLDACPTASVIFTPDTEFGGMYLLEVSRGCGRGCRFCLAGHIYRPPRERSLARLLAQARGALETTFSKAKVGLVGAAVSDYSHIEELLRGLREMGARVSLSSLRADSLSPAMLESLVESGTRTLALAPEAGTERLRRIINKPISDEQVLRAAELASRYGLPQLKLYFMVGLPTETEEDVHALADLSLAVRKRFGGRLIVNLAPFVPKAHTPFQWAAMASLKTLRERLRLAEGLLRRQGVTVRAESPAWSRVQGVLARGDSRLGLALARITGLSLAAWRKALRESGLEEEEFLRARPPGEPLPWFRVDCGITPAYLQREWEEAHRGGLTPPCPPRGCVRCGVCPSS